MYSVFPYGQSHVNKFVSELNKYSATDVKKALEKDYDTLKKIIGFSFDQEYLHETMFQFIDDVVKTNICTDGDFGNLMEKRLVKIYDQEVELTAEEQALNQEVGDETLSIEQQDVVDKIRSSEEVNQQEQKVKLQDKAFLLDILDSSIRKYLISNPSRIQKQSLKVGGKKYACVAESFTGKHTPIKSDHHGINPKNRNLFAVICDGTTNNYTKEDNDNHSQRELEDCTSEISISNARLFTGYNAAKPIAETITSFPFSQLGYFDFSQLGESNDFKADLMKYFKQIGADMKKGFQFKKSDDKNIIQQYIEWLEGNGDRTTASLLKDKRLQFALIASMPLFNGMTKALSSIKTIYKDRKKDVSAATTTSYCFEMNGKIISVQAGDSDVAAYGENNRKLKPEKTLYINHYEQDCSKIQVGFRLYYDSEADEHRGKAFFPLKYKISVYDKNDVHKIAMISDGAAIYSNGRELPDELDGSIEENLSKIAYSTPGSEENPHIDDKTAIFIAKAA